MNIRTIIVDDESPARRRISLLLSRGPSFEIVAECADGNSATSLISEKHPDLVFHDVQILGGDGFAVLESIADSALPFVIFVTAHDQYALRAFEVSAIDYLLKPFSRKRFWTCIERAKQRITERRWDEEKDQVRALLRKTSADHDRLVFRNKGNLLFLKAREIEWIQASGNYVRFHMGNRVETLRATFGDLEHRLPPEKFLRIHRSVIVNIDAVARIQCCGAGEYIVLLRNGRELPLGRSYRDRLDSVVQRDELSPRQG